MEKKKKELMWGKKKEYWRGLPFPPPGDLSNPGIKPRFPALQEDSLPSEPPGKPIGGRSGIRVQAPGDFSGRSSDVQTLDEKLGSHHLPRRGIFSLN